MGEVALLVLGAVVGALSTGGVQAWDANRQRRDRRRVAARMILGDLYVLEAGIEVILEHSRWPDRFDTQAITDTWREAREAFAGGVEAWEWALVDGLFSNYARTALMIRHGEPTTSNDEDVLRTLLAAIPRARDVVLEHSTSEDERERLMTELSQRRE